MSKQLINEQVQQYLDKLYSRQKLSEHRYSVLNEVEPILITTGAVFAAFLIKLAYNIYKTNFAKSVPMKCKKYPVNSKTSQARGICVLQEQIKLIQQQITTLEQSKSKCKSKFKEDKEKNSECIYKIEKEINKLNKQIKTLQTKIGISKQIEKDYKSKK